MKKIMPVSRLLLAIASLMMLMLYFVPFWQILMWAPQYPEGLAMQIWINKLSGDVEIINGLNHYIGMKHIKVEMFPEFKIMPWLIGGIIAFGLIAAASGRKFMLWSFMAILIITGITGLVDFWMWGYDYGHNLDPTAPIQVPGMSYQPPLIGSKTLLNFLAYSGPDTGGWIMVSSALLTIFIILFEKFKNK
jgi:copper chaperone NosL